MSVLLLLCCPLSLLVASVTSAYTSDCNCGYGGLCLDSELPEALPCNFCTEASKGYYVKCDEIANHCKSSPCENGGRCVQTFGSYFCRCPKGYFGQKCQIADSTLSRLGVSNELYVYHQVQPDKYGMSYFTIIYDAVALDMLGEETNFELLVNISTVDGRFYYPTREDEFVLVNVKQKCIRESTGDPTLYDLRICDLLPDGRVWAYEVDASTPFWAGWLEGSHFISFNNSIIAVTGYINVIVQFKYLSTNVVLVLFEQTYPFLQYTAGRKIPYNCPMRVHFGGCGKSLRDPIHYTRGAHIKAYGAIHLPRRCRALLILERGWSLQRDIMREVVYLDREPQELPSFNNSDVVDFQPKFFQVGFHMLQYSFRIRGTPPHYGSPREFVFPARCWIKVSLNPPIFYVKGGIYRTASCLRPLRLTIEQFDRGMSVHEFHYFGQCNVTTDPECSTQSLAGHVLTKLNTPCRTTYEFIITAEHVDKVFHNITPFTATVTFINSDLTFEIQCWFNCHPIDPSYRVMAVATTTPYDDYTVVWTVKVDDREIKERDGLVDIFRDSTATRLIRIDGYRFQSDTDTTTVQFTAQRPDLSELEVTILTFVDNIKTKINLFQFFWNDHRAWFVITADPEYKFPPVTYTANHVFLDTRIFYVEDLSSVRSTRYPLEIDIDTTAPLVQLCAFDAYNIGFCSKFEVLPPEQLSPVPKLFTYEVVRDTLVRGYDHHEFLNRFAVIMAQTLYPSYGSAFRHRLPYSQRRELVRLLRNVDYPNPMAVIQAFTVVSTFFYSDLGCADQEFVHPFKPRYVKSPLEMSSVFRLRYETLETVTLLSQNLFGKVKATNELSQSPFGSVSKVFFQSFILAYIQSHVFNHRYVIHVNNEDERNRLVGEALFFRDYNAKLMWAFLWRLIEVNTYEKVGFYGLSHLGGSDYCLLWSALTTYQGIINYLNRSVSRTETLRGYVNYIFEHNSTIENPWVEKHNLQFPLDLPDGADINHQTLINFAVVLARQIPCVNATLPCDEQIISAYMMLQFRDKNKNRVDVVPPPGYIVSFPIMRNGSLATSEFMWEKIILTKSPGNIDETLWFKVSLSHLTPIWESAIIFDNLFPLQVLADVDHLPDLDDLRNSPTVKSVKIDSGILENRSIYKKTVHNFRRIANISSYFMALNLPSSLPPGRYNIWFNRAYSQCVVRHPLWNYLSECATVADWFESQNENIVKCRCNHLGLVYAPLKHVRYRQLLVEAVAFVGLKVILPGILFPALLLVSIALFVTFALIADHWRLSKDLISYVGHVYPTATYPMIIGVLTGLQPLAGTYSRIAMQMIGELSTTGVIVLSSEASKNERKYLNSDSDVWFATAVKDPPGEIRKIRIWQDFYCISDWYCSCILIHDVHESRWYIVDVHRWFKMYQSDENSRMVELSTEGWMPDKEEIWARQTQTFDRFFFRELRNTHAPLCLFLLHSRNVSGLEQKCFEYIAKILSTSVLSWIYLAYFVEAFPHRFFDYYNPEERLIHVHLNPIVNTNWFTLIWIVIIAFLTRVFVFPLHYFYRSIMMSKMIRRQTSSRSISVRRSMSSKRSSSRRSRSAGLSWSARRSVSGLHPLTFRRSTAQHQELERRSSALDSHFVDSSQLSPASKISLSPSRRSKRSPLSPSKKGRSSRRSEFSHGSSSRSHLSPTSKSASPSSQGSGKLSTIRQPEPNSPSLKAASELIPSSLTPSTGLLAKPERPSSPDKLYPSSKLHILISLPPDTQKFAHLTSQPESKESAQYSEMLSEPSSAPITDDMKNEEWHWCWWIWIGPTHFKSVNADQRILKNRQRSYMNKARIYLGFLAVGTLILFSHVAATSDFWGKHTSAIIFYIFMTLFLDASVVEPVFIFFKSFIAYVFCEVTNSPIIHIWNTNKKNDIAFRPNLGWEQYLEVQAFRPLLSSDLERKRRTRHQLMIGFLSVVYLIMLLVGCNLYYIVSSRHIQSKQRFKSMNIEVESESITHSLFDKDKVTIYDVIDYKSAYTYVTTSYSRVVTLRSNGKNISKDGRYWDISGYTLPFSSTKMITLYYSRSALNASSLPKIFEGLQFLQMNKMSYFYHESTQETKTLVINTVPVKYEVVNPWIKLIGDSGTAYPLAGHTKDFRLWSAPGSSFISWPDYFAKLRLAMEVIYTSAQFLIQAQDLEPSAILLLRNSYAPNLHLIGTLDVTIEFHPSGVCAGVIEINCILAIILFAINVYILCKVGVRKYFRTPLYLLLALFWVACFAWSFSAAYISSSKTGLMDSVSDSMSPYLDLHTVLFIHYTIDAAIVGLTFVILAVVSSLVLGYIFKREKIVIGLFGCAVICLPVMILILAWMILALTQCQVSKSLRNALPLLSAIMMEMTPLDRYSNTFSIQWYQFIVFTVVFIILKKFFQCLVITQFRKVDLMETPVTIDLRECGLLKEYQFMIRRSQPAARASIKKSMSPIDQPPNRSRSPSPSTLSTRSGLINIIKKKGIFF